jgi:hypothetical protein
VAGAGLGSLTVVLAHWKPPGGRPLDVFIAGDDAGAKERVSSFIESLGFRPLDAGDLKMAHWLEGAGLLMVAPGVGKAAGESNVEPRGTIFHVHGGGFALGSAAGSVGLHRYSSNSRRLRRRIALNGPGRQA